MYQFFLEEEGTAAIEYGLLISFIGIAIAGVIQMVGPSIFEVLTIIGEVLSPVQVTQNL